MKKAFFDTNVLIAKVFHINSLHQKSKNAFNSYSQYFWSSYVRDEFDNRFDEKLDNLPNFFFDLQKFLENPEQELYSLSDLENFVRKYYTDKKMEDAQSSIAQFWQRYIGIESQLSFFNLKNNIDDCLNDLTIGISLNKKNLKKYMQLTPQRTNIYSNIDSMLKNEGVRDTDRIITLDGHDFACFSRDPIDFVTFDENCCNGAKNIDILCFNSIKGKYDFNAS